MEYIFVVLSGYNVYILILGLSSISMAVSFFFAKRVSRFAGSKKANPQDEANEKWNDHLRQISLNLSFIFLAAVTAISIFNLQRRQQKIFSDRDMADRAMFTINDIVNQQLEALKFIYMLDLRLPSFQDDNKGFDIFRNALVHASSERQVDFSIAEIKTPFSINDLKIHDRKIYGYISRYDLDSLSALTYTMSSVVDELSSDLNDEKLNYGIYNISPDKKARIESHLFQSRSVAAEYIISLCALYSRLNEAVSRSDLGQDFEIEVTPDMRFADQLDFADVSIDIYMRPMIATLHKLRHKSIDCFEYTKDILKEGNAIIPYLRDIK